MDEHRAKVGFLTSLNSNEEEGHLSQNILIFQGVNVVGRKDIVRIDKRISRKHVTINAWSDGSAELSVEGPNPVIVKSGDQRKKICYGGRTHLVHGDILELIPGNFVFQYTALPSEVPTTSFKDDSIVSDKLKGIENGEIISLKRKRQILKDDALARSLQDKWENGTSVKESTNINEDSEAIRHFNVPLQKIPSTFRLLRVQGLPEWANFSSVSIEDVIQGNVLFAVLSNYMVDIDWLISACPIISKVPHVFVIHGESDGALDYMKRQLPNWTFHKPPLPISYGTHHSKAMLLVYPQGIRVVVHTANLIHVDWNNKSQGLWVQDFPWKYKEDTRNGCAFENDLSDYLYALKWPDFTVDLPIIGNATINPSFFRKFDYSTAMVRLVASVPGYHKGPNLKKWGHMKVQSILQECVFDKEFEESPLVYQFSSLGSLDEKWMQEFASSMSSGLSQKGTSLGLGKAMIIWPTVEDVRCSLEGYSAGSAIPSPQKNVEKDFLKKYWARWSANHTGRSRAMPHIKSYARYNGQNLAWFLLTSANLSKAAWGALQKNNSQLMIRSYELGVLFLPSTSKQHEYKFCCTADDVFTQRKYESVENTEICRTKLVTLCWQENSHPDPKIQINRLPVPYQLPSLPYTVEDVPWSWDRRYLKKDVYGQVWPQRVPL